MEWLRCLQAKGLTGLRRARGSRAAWKYPQCSTLAPPFTAVDKAQLNASFFKKTKQTGKPADDIWWMKCCFFFPRWVSGQSGSRIGLRSQGGTAWSCYCWDFFNSASASWTRDAEKVRGGDEGVCVCVLKKRISVYASAATEHRKPPVSMGTGKTPCTFYCGRGEAPAFRSDRRGRNGPLGPDPLCNVCCL